jgi:tripartite ATP-independent transporter DctP family solute receptor
MKDKGIQPIRLATWALAALAVGMLAAAPALAQTKELRFGHLHSAESPVHKGITRGAEEFAKLSGGRYKINVFPSSQLGAAREMVAQVIDGTLDFVSEGPGSLSNLNKALSLFEAPFVARDWDHVQKMLASPFGQEQLGKLAHDRNMVHVGTFYYGVRHFTTRSKPLQTAAEVKGLKIRVPEAPLFLAMIRALEATPTPMSLGEVYLSLQTGVADGQENPVGTINDQKFYEVQKYLNLTGHVIVPILIMVNKKAYDAMTPGDQQSLRAAFVEGAKVNDELTRANEARLTDFFKSKGMTIVNSDRESFRKKMSSVIEVGEKDMGWPKGIFDRMQAIR